MARDGEPPRRRPTTEDGPRVLADVEDLVAAPRVSGLALSPDGTRLVTTVATVAPDGKRYRTSLWEIDPQGRRPPRRLTHSKRGEEAPVFAADGSLLFLSDREDPDVRADGGEEPRAALWMLPVGGGEAVCLAAPPGGIDAVAVARASGRIVVAAEFFPDATSEEEDERRGRARHDAGVAALLLEGFPYRFWDRWLGPRDRRLLVLEPPPLPPRRQQGRDLVGFVARRLVETDMDVTPDGRTIVTGWRGPGGRQWQADLCAIDVATGERRVLASADADHLDVACSPDGRFVVCRRAEWGTLERAPRRTLWLVDLETGQGRDLTPDLDVWPQHPRWSADSRTVYFTADERGRTPIFRVDVASGEVVRVTAEGCFSDLCPSPDGHVLYALRSSLAYPPEIVVIDAAAVDGRPCPLPTPGLPLEMRGHVEEFTVPAPDGTPIHTWLVLPAETSARRPAPLLLWVHGGPMMAWGSWSWRWCAQLMAAKGYAVLMPNPALSQGFGQAFVQRGWGRWGEATTTDLMAVLDAVVQRPDIDPRRVGLMGGSFGGYMANWLAGHTDRFAAIVSHAGVWSLDQSHGTADDAPWFEREFGPLPGDTSRYDANSPHRFADRIRTPMLVIHGERDFRVPAAEGIRLFTILQLQGVPSQFLYFPDEGHWILKPQNVRLWYQTVLAFLEHHVRGGEWQRPDFL